MDYKELKETIDILEKLPDGDRDKMLKLVLTNKSVEQEKPVVGYKQKGLIEEFLLSKGASNLSKFLTN